MEGEERREKEEGRKGKMEGGRDVGVNAFAFPTTHSLFSCNG